MINVLSAIVNIFGKLENQSGTQNTKASDSSWLKIAQTMLGYSESANSTDDIGNDSFESQIAAQTTTAATENQTGNIQTTKAETQAAQATTTEQSAPEENPNYSVEDFVKDDAVVSGRISMAERQAKFEKMGTDIAGIDKLYYTNDPKQVVNDYEKFHKGYSYAKQKYSSMISEHDKNINSQMNEYSKQYPNATKSEWKTYKNNIEVEYRNNNNDYKTYIEAKEAYDQKILEENNERNAKRDRFLDRF